METTESTEQIAEREEAARVWAELTERRYNPTDEGDPAYVADDIDGEVAEFDAPSFKVTLVADLARNGEDRTYRITVQPTEWTDSVDWQAVLTVAHDAGLDVFVENNGMTLR